MELLDDTIPDIYSLMETFPVYQYGHIQEIAYSLGIKNIASGESILNPQQYILLKNQLAQELLDTDENTQEYMINQVTQDIPAIDISVVQCTQEKSFLSESLNLETLKRKKSLNPQFMLEAIQSLGIKDVDGLVIVEMENMKSIYISQEDSEKVTQKAYQLNAKNANNLNPRKQKNDIPDDCITIKEVSDEYNIDVSRLIEETQVLKLQYIRNEKTYIKKSVADKLISRIQEKTKDNASEKVELEASQMPETSSIFETLIQKDTLVFIDTCSLMNPGMPDIIDNDIIPTLKKYGKTVYIVDSVIHEVYVKMKNNKNLENQQKAEMAQGILKKLIDDDLYQIPETYSVNKHFADAELITVFSDLRLKYNLCLITNDNSNGNNGGLSNSILELQTSTCINEESIKEITVLYVDNIENTGLVKYLKDRDKESKLHEKAPLRVTL